MPSLKKIKVPHKILSSSESELSLDFSNQSDDELSEDQNEYCNESILDREPVLNDYVLVKFEVKSRSSCYYLGKIIGNKNQNDELEISYLRLLSKCSSKFVCPDKPDFALVALKDIKLILPEPILLGHTSRQRSAIVFNVDFSSYNIK